MALFWCEFPDKVNFERVNEICSEEDYFVEVGIAVSTPEQYRSYEEQFKKYSHLKLVRAWPVLSKKEGYWFSSKTSPDSIMSLTQWHGIPIKLDIEPRIPEGEYTWKTMLWFLFAFGKGKHHELFVNVLDELSEDTDVMLSTFMLPKFLLRNLGWVEGDYKYNFIHYSTFTPKPLRKLYNLYFKHIYKSVKHLNPYVAVGLLTVGIFGNEPVYGSVEEFKKDLEFLDSIGAKKIVVFRLGSLQERSDAKEFLKVLKNAKL